MEIGLELGLGLGQYVELDSVVPVLNGDDAAVLNGDNAAVLVAD